ncbi:hypothetical protein RN001_014631 [Aquatica leii]|uniref:Regulatory protein zeste n=1 Tax=Aquatica leii TaxID=1421715 RepID=A0AAN7PPL1_9COLE|nr:hypothetical protein RN001_014631 [Aquatica leii]
MNNEKRNRSTNFTLEEELHLVQEIQKVKHILECKTTNSISIKQKEAAWNEVLTKYNSFNRTRSLLQLKSKYDNLKTGSRKYAANCRAAHRGTGGGPPLINDIKSAIYDIVIEILNKKTVAGLDNSYDDDATEIVDSKSPRLNDVLLEFTGDEFNAMDVVYENDGIVSTIPEGEQQFITTETNNESKQVGTSTAAPQVQPIRSSKERWSYTPKTLKRKSKKLIVNEQNTVVNLKEKYILLKTTALEEERQDRKKRLVMDEEYHRVKMELIKIEIELKRKQL